MKKFWLLIVFLLLLIPIKGYAYDAAVTGALSLSAMSSMENISEKNSTIGNFFAPKGGVSLETITFDIKETMNQKGAVKVHTVIIYRPEIFERLMEMTADQYFQRVDQFKNDHPDRMIILAWEFGAKERLTPKIKIEYPVGHMIPIAAIVFIKYDSPGEHRAVIAPSWKNITIILEEKDFRIVCTDRRD